MAAQLTSTRNTSVQMLRKAVQSGRPTAEGLIVAEGPHLLAEAASSAWQVEAIFCTEEAKTRFSRLFVEQRTPVTTLTEHVLAAVSGTETSQGVLALVRPRAWKWVDLVSQSTLIVVLDGVQDPGNAGTIIRSAEAFGATGIVLARGCARVSNGKLLRATAGSIFRIPFLEGILPNELPGLAAGIPAKLYGLMATGGIPIQQADFRAPCVIAVGSEGSGLSAELITSTYEINVLTERVESLNAAVACSVTLFEAARQRAGSRV